MYILVITISLMLNGDIVQFRDKALPRTYHSMTECNQVAKQIWNEYRHEIKDGKMGIFFDCQLKK